jgi:aspartate aminotransferase-like enzyme
MIALWGALKSCLLPGERVLSVATGVFGYGIGEMARSIGAQVKVIGLGYDQTITDWTQIEQAIAEFKPKMITVVHCETPSGTLNPLLRLGELKQAYHVPLLYVDAVASIGGAPVLTDQWHIDLALGGAQKCLSAPPGMSFLSVSQAAWEVIDHVDYIGYDALKPFRSAQKNFYFPYTPYWHGMATLNAGAQLILEEGLEHCYQRHAQVAGQCRQRLVGIGAELFPAPNAVQSPTVTAVKVPDGIPWPELDRRFRQHGLVVAGSYGPLAGKVYRLGHMGSQADPDLVEKALAVVEAVMHSI